MLILRSMFGTGTPSVPRFTMEQPVIWTANDIGVLGPAVLRRMTMCLEVRVPNLATRTKLWRRMGEVEGVVL